MSRHAAPDELLLDYAAGVLAEGPALAVALHVALDPLARRTVQQLRGVGGALLEDEAGIDMGDAALERALARLDALPIEAAAAVPAVSAAFGWAPPPLRPYLPGKSWKPAFGGFDEIPLDLHGDPHRVSLLKLEPGNGLPRHRHSGAEEFTVVLQGGYTDRTGNYGVGDFAVGPGMHEQEHEPIADPGEPCIALIVLDKPIVLTSFWGRLFNPLLRRGWL